MFEDAPNLRFRYMLEGHDQAWIDAGSRRAAFYTRLAPGTYQFMVSASVAEGPWSSDVATLAFTLRPFLYQTRGFYVLCAAGVVALVWWTARLRLRRLRARFALVLDERTRIARELHDTLLQGFTAVTLKLDGVQASMHAGDVAAGREELEQALGLADACLVEAREAVWNMRDPIVSPALADYVVACCAKATTPGCTVVSEVIGTPFELPVARVVDVRRVIDEALSNALRHSRASHVCVSVVYGRGEVTVAVRDNGCGFDVAQARSARSGHWGLAGLEERARHAAATVSIESTLGQGTLVRYVVRR